MGITCIVAAMTRSSARAATKKSAAEAAYNVAFTAIRVIRAAEYDRWANSKTTNCVYDEDIVKRELKYLTEQDGLSNADPKGESK